GRGRQCGSSCLHPTNPVTRASSLVRDREDPNDGWELDERDRVRKAPSGGTTNTKSARHARIERKATRAACDRCEHRIDFCQELTAKTFAPLLVPQSGRSQLFLRLGLYPDSLHGRRSFDSISARAADQSSPPSESASTRRARRSISTIQASAESPSFGPSRLAT